MYALSTKGSVVGKIRNGNHSTTGPGVSPCKHSPNDNHGKTKPETRQNQRRENLEKVLDLAEDNKVHGNSAEWENNAYEYYSYNDSSLQTNAQTSRYLEEYSVHTASGCHLQSRFNQTLQHSNTGSDDGGEPQLLAYQPQSWLKQNRANKKVNKKEDLLSRRNENSPADVFLSAQKPLDCNNCNIVTW